jgi:hypothetical protein
MTIGSARLVAGARAIMNSKVQSAEILDITPPLVVRFVQITFEIAVA